MTPELWPAAGPGRAERSSRRRAGRGVGGAAGRWPSSAASPPPPSCSPPSTPCRPPRTRRGCPARTPTAPDPGFRLVRLLRPVRGLLALTIVLVGLDALTTLAFPTVARYAVDSGSPGQRRPAADRRAARAGDRRAELGGGRRPDRGDGPGRGEPALPAARAQLRPPAAARARLLRARAVRPDHDPDDHGRRRAVDVPADRAGAGRRQPAHGRRGGGRAAASPTRSWRWWRSPCCRCWSRRRCGSGAVVARLRRGARAGGRRQRRHAGERDRRAGRPGLHPGAAQLRGVRRPQPRPTAAPGCARSATSRRSSRSSRC